MTATVSLPPSGAAEGGGASAAPSPARASVRSAERAWRELLRTSTALLREFEERGDFEGLSIREYDVLRALAETRDGEARLGALAQVTYLPQPSMSRLVERMEGSGLVSRCPAPQDGRGRLVRLTDAGRERFRAVGRAHLRSIHAVVSAALTETQARDLADLAARLRPASDHLEDE